MNPEAPADSRLPVPSEVEGLRANFCRPPRTASCAPGPRAHQQPDVIDVGLARQHGRQRTLARHQRELDRLEPEVGRQLGPVKRCARRRCALAVAAAAPVHARVRVRNRTALAKDTAEASGRHARAKAGLR